MKKEVRKKKTKQIDFGVDEWQEIIDAIPVGGKAATFIRDTVLDSVRNETSEFHVKQLDSTIPIISHVQCGPFTEILESAERISLGDLPPLLGIKPDDFLTHTEGKSMESDNPAIHIPEGSILLMRPFCYPDNETCFVRITGSGGISRYTIKRWIKLENGDCELRDGMGNKVEVGEDEDAYPIAVKRGAIVPAGNAFREKIKA